MIWTTKQIWIDLDTGSIISKWDAKDNYHIIKKYKEHANTKNAFKGIITIYYECRRNEYKQPKLF